jgi:hypothetical protein
LKTSILGVITSYGDKRRKNISIEALNSNHDQNTDECLSLALNFLEEPQVPLVPLDASVGHLIILLRKHSVDAHQAQSE